MPKYSSGGVAAHELDYVEKETNTTISATAVSASNTIVTASELTFDGATAVLIEFYAGIVEPGATAGDKVLLQLFDGSTSIAQLGQVRSPVVTTTPFTPVHLVRRITPSEAAHTYSIRAYRVGTSNGTVYAGSGGEDLFAPAFIRITVADLAA